MIKPLLFSMLALLPGIIPKSFGQAVLLSIDSCYAKAQRNYPLVKQYDLLAKSTEYSLSNADKAYIASFQLAGQATYQSDVTEIPFSMPGASIEPLSQDQYRFYGELNQPITDLLVLKKHKELIKANAAVEQQKLEVELFKIKDRINHLFFGILLIDAQISQAEILKKDLSIGIEKTEAAIENGMAIRSSADKLKAELLKADQRIIELRANRAAYTSMLSLFTGIENTEKFVLQKPSPILTGQNIIRPEITLFDLQKQSISLQSAITSTKTMPRLGLFLQGGVGRPGLNMLSNDFEAYYIGGIKLSWNISSFYTNHNEKKILNLNQKGLEVQKDVFLFNTGLNVQQQNSEIDMAKNLIQSDQSIITLREAIRNDTREQLENGTATTNDYLMAVNDLDKARQNLLLHEIQLLLNQYKLKTTTGN